MNAVVVVVVVDERDGSGRGGGDGGMVSILLFLLVVSFRSSNIICREDCTTKTRCGMAAEQPPLLVNVDSARSSSGIFQRILGRT